MSTEKTRLTKWDKLMMAITFAEANEAETARGILEKTSKKEKRPENQSINRPDMRV